MPQMVGSIPWNLIHGRINNGLNGLVNMDGTQGLALLGTLGPLTYLGLWIIMMNCKCMGIEARQGNNSSPVPERAVPQISPWRSWTPPPAAATTPPSNGEPESEPILCVHGTHIVRKTKDEMGEAWAGAASESQAPVGRFLGGGAAVGRDISPLAHKLPGLRRRNIKPQCSTLRVG